MTEFLSINSAGRHIRMVWKGVNEGVVYNECFAQEFDSTSCTLQEVTKCSIMQDPILRYLSIQSFHVFETVQNMKDVDLEKIVLKSREYRAILAECEEQIVNEVQKMDSCDKYDEDKYVFITSHCNIIKDYQMLWHLAEIFFIKLSSGGFLVQDLQGWLNLQQPYVSFDYNNLMDRYNAANGDIELETEKNYWPTVFSLAIQGRKTELLNLLICNTLSNSQAMRTMRTVVDLLPVFSQEYMQCPMEFELVWNKWHRLAENQLIDSGLLSPYHELVILADILLGKKEAFFNETMMNLSQGCWYYAFVPYLLYSQPLITVAQISRCFKDFKRSFQAAATSMDDVCSEEILQAVSATFGLNLSEFIGAISKNSNNWWLPAHLVDIIEKINPHLFPTPLPAINGSQIFRDNSVNDVYSLKEFFVLQHASGMASQHSLTLMALNYMSYCPVMGRAHITQILDHMYLPTDRFATLIHSWCVQRKYDDIAGSICKRMAVAAFKRNHLGNSVAWSIKCNDAHFISRIADKLLGAALAPHTAADDHSDSLLDCIKGINIGLCGKKMTFVVRFYELRQLIAAKRSTEACACLMKLLASQLVSSEHNLAMLRCVRPLLAVSGTVGVLELHALMALLERVRETAENAAEMNQLRQLMVMELAYACLV